MTILGKSTRNPLSIGVLVGTAVFIVGFVVIVVSTTVATSRVTSVTLQPGETKRSSVTVVGVDIVDVERSAADDSAGMTSSLTLGPGGTVLLLGLPITAFVVTSLLVYTRRRRHHPPGAGEQKVQPRL